MSWGQYLRRLIHGPQPDRRIFRDIGIPDEMPLHHPAQRPSVLWIKKKGLPRLLIFWGAFAAVIAVVAAVVSMFR